MTCVTKDQWPTDQTFSVNVSTLYELCLLVEVAPIEYVPKVVRYSLILFKIISAIVMYFFIFPGEIISTSAKEVQNITASLNIQVDNPICILNQDTSRNFLSSNDPKHKFTLFMKATRLETLEAEYRKIQSNKHESVKIMEEKEEVIKSMGMSFFLTF